MKQYYERKKLNETISLLNGFPNRNEAIESFSSRNIKLNYLWSVSLYTYFYFIAIKQHSTAHKSVWKAYWKLKLMRKFKKNCQLDLPSI